MLFVRTFIPGSTAQGRYRTLLHIMDYIGLGYSKAIGYGLFVTYYVCQS